jgi:hypothetical protein
MKTLLGILTIVLFAVGIAACGSSSKGASGSVRGSSAAVATTSNDRDDDGDKNDDDSSFLNYGHAANASEMRPLVTLVTDYFAAAATENGAKACKLLMPFVAESVVENLSHGPGLSGRSCAVVMSKLFKQHHSELETKSATLKFYAVRVGPGKALTLLSFSRLAPEVRQLDERRDSSGAWKILMLLDGIIE